MQYKTTVLTAAATFLVGLSSAAFIPTEPWSTLTPDASAPSGALTDYTSTFGIAVVPVTASAKAKRDVATQVVDGQIQATTATTITKIISQIVDGQVQATTVTTEVVTQIGDGQIQATTGAQVVTQIGDGQIQATTGTAQVIGQIGDGQIQATTGTAQVIGQIGDGQIQATTGAHVVSQIGDGQIQATTGTTTAVVISQIGDGQIQATTGTATPVTQIGDGQIQATGHHASQIGDGQVQGTAAASADPPFPNIKVSCKDDSALALTLNGGELTDSKGRIGSIVANRQFQFDGPPPQAGTIFAGGWSVTKEGLLALGDQTVFFQCLSGSFFNLYDESIGDQCQPINLEIVNLISC